MSTKDVRKESIMRLASKAITACFLCLLLFFALKDCRAQQAAAVSSGSASGNTSTSVAAIKAQLAAADTRYRIGPGDVLDVRVARAPELSREAVRVDQSGMIRMPMLDVDIPAACLTEAELAQNIAKLYKKYKNDPHVEVFVKEYQSQPVAVIGAVRGPAQFKLQRQVKLLELLSLVGGPADTAGQSVQIVHAGGIPRCGESGNPITTDDTSAFVSYKLNDTLKGVPEANPFVQPGDIVSVPQADQVFVLGNVLKPA